MIAISYIRILFGHVTSQQITSSHSIIWLGNFLHEGFNPYLFEYKIHQLIKLA